MYLSGLLSNHPNNLSGILVGCIHKEPVVGLTAITKVESRICFLRTSNVFSFETRVSLLCLPIQPNRLPGNKSLQSFASLLRVHSFSDFNDQFLKKQRNF